MASKATSVEIDLSNYKDKVGSRVKNGRYLVVVEDCEMDQSAAGNKMINMWFRVVGKSEYADAVIVDRLVLTEKSLFRVVGFMQAIGLPTPRKKLQVNIALWKGKRLYIDVEDGEPYNGRVKSEVRGYDKVRTVAAVEGDNDELNALAGLTSEPGGGGDDPVEEFRPSADDIAAGVAEATELGRMSDDERAAAIEGLDEVDLDALQL